LSVFFLNHNYNPFRLQAEWTIAVLLVMSIRWRFPGNRWTIALLAPIYVVILLFQIYYAVMHWIYGETPSFTNEFILMREVLPVYLAGNGIPNVLVWSGLIVFLVILLWLANVMARRGVQTGTVLLHFTAGRIILALIPAFIAISAYRYAKADPHDLRLNSQWVYPRIQDAFHVSTEDPLDRLEERSAIYQTWRKDQVQDLPNIYLIFIESYGAVAHLSSYVQEPFQATLKQLEDSLRADGWNSRSTYSLAPIKGGRSWLSFTSALLGVKIRNQVDYNRLYHLTFRYPHLIRYLNDLGYTTHRINTMQTNEQTDALIPYESVATFHEFDDWVLFPDIPTRDTGIIPSVAFRTSMPWSMYGRPASRGIHRHIWCSLSHWTVMPPGSHHHRLPACIPILTPFGQAHMARIEASMRTSWIDTWPPWSMNGLSCPSSSVDMRLNGISSSWSVITNPRPWSIRSGIRSMIMPSHCMYWPKAGTSMISWHPISSRAA